MGGKSKKNKANKNVDAVEEAKKDEVQNKEQVSEPTQPDTVKQEQIKNDQIPVEQGKTQIATQAQIQNTTTQDTLANDTNEGAKQQVTQNAQNDLKQEEKIPPQEAQPEKQENSASKDIQIQQKQQVVQPVQSQKIQEVIPEQPKKQVQQPAEQILQQIKTTQQIIPQIQQPKANVQPQKQQHIQNQATQQVQPEKLESRPRDVELQQKSSVVQQSQPQKPSQIIAEVVEIIEEKKIQTQELSQPVVVPVIPEVAQVAEVVEQHKKQQNVSVVVTEVVEQKKNQPQKQNEPANQPLIKNQNELKQQQPVVNAIIQNNDLSYQKQLEDGLKLVGQFAENYVFQNPLSHQQQAHGGSKFIQNFEPAAYHLNERLLQQENKTPPKEKQNLFANNQSQILQQIKQSAQSIDPDPLEFTESQDPRVSILRSYHSESEEQEKKKTQPVVQPPKPEQHVRKQSQSNRSNAQSRKSSAVLHPPENPTYTNPIPIVPSVPTNTLAHQTPNRQIPQQIKQKPKSQLDFQAINKQALRQREQQWRLMQQKQLQPINPQFHLIKPINVQIQPATANAPQKLNYTNNLPIISHQRIEQKKQQIKKQSEIIKQKLSENEKLRKDIKQNNIVKKLGISIFVTGLCLGACVLGKIDKKIATGASLASFVASYWAQK